jgi:eukaryotic-like serine/threonine-protein kinase
MMKQIAGVSKYTVIRWMYTGPISSVFEVSDANGNLFVLKALNRQHRFSSDLRGEFIDEARRLIDLNHPALIDGLYFGLADDDLPFFVMERADESLFDTLQRGRLSTNSALHVVTQIGDALDYLHANSLVHRDVKPRNVFMFRKNNSEVVKLGDLGLVRNFHYTLTVAGTASYAAVETIEGRSVVEMFRSRSDIYSLSVIATQLLTGELPPLHFRNGGPWFDRVPGCVAEVLLRGMQNEPSERFVSGKEFVGALTAVLASRSLQGTP